MGHKLKLRLISQLFFLGLCIAPATSYAGKRLGACPKSFLSKISCNATESPNTQSAIYSPLYLWVARTYVTSRT